MAVYSKLLLSAGGGVISTQQQADQAKGMATVLIGLGGTGVDCLRTIKTQVYARLKPDDPEAVIPQYSHIRFLGVDTDESSKGDYARDNTMQGRPEQANSWLALDDTEFLSIADGNVKKNFKNPKALEQKDELDWLNWERIPAPDLTKQGAGGYRQVGRYMLMTQMGKFVTQVRQAIDNAKMGLAEPTVNIHIFSGLSGGTGAGTFLDVCYMLRSIADEIGNVTLFGYFFLPDVNLARIPLSDTKTRDYIPKNGYAAMQELDYCMQLKFNGGSFVQTYPGHNDIKWEDPPVDMCHLICATNAAGDVIENAYDYAMNVTAEYLMDFLTYSKGFGLSSQLTNFSAKVVAGDGQKTHGFNLAYCVLGASCATIPLREINTYLASELFERFSQIGGNVPSQADVEHLAFAALARNANSIGDVYNALLRELSEGAESSYAPYQDDWKFVRNFGNADLVSNYTNQTAAKKNRAEANAKSLTTPGNRQSLIHRLNTRLQEILRDIRQGPIFAYRMLSAAESHNLLNLIDGLLAENNARWAQEAAQTDLRERDYENAKSDFENRRSRKLFDSDQKRFNDYEFYLMLLNQHQLAMYLYEHLNQVLKQFREQVVDVTAEYYIKLARVTETLINTFAENRAALSREKVLQGKSSFAIPMMTIAELKKTLDAKIEEINIPNMLDAFMLLLVQNRDEWIVEDEYKISKLVTRFFIDTAFGDFANRTITAFLQDKYETQDQAVLTHLIYENWIKELTKKARPLFYFNESIWREEGGAEATSQIAYVSIPAMSAPIKAAAQQQYAADNKWEVKESALTDRIYVMCTACALPICSYNECGKYEKSYFSSEEPGRHYYEGKPVSGTHFNNWYQLFSLTPQSLVDEGSAPAPLAKLLQKGHRLYDEVRKRRILNDDNTFCRPSQQTLASAGALAQRAAAFADSLSVAEQIPQAEALQQELAAAKDLPLEPTEMFLKKDGHVAQEAVKLRIQEDYFISSPAYSMLAEEIIAEIDKAQASLQDAADKLQRKARSIKDTGRELLDYFDAVFSGVIQLDGVSVKYLQVKYGIRNETVLSQKGDEYPFGRIPLYQGYLNYQSLEDPLKQEIKQAVNNRMNSGMEQVRAAGAKLKPELSDERINAWAQIASLYEQRADIISFLEKLKQQFDLFCLENAL